MEAPSTIIITAIAIILIIALAFLMFYFSVKPAPEEEISFSLKPQKQVSAEKQVAFTKVINFSVPETLPKDSRDGYCFVSSVAQPYRTDAWRCMVDSSIYDPCFKTALADVVYCLQDPSLNSGDFLIKLNKPLPLPEVPKTLQDNWAWFLELEDGTVCSPFTGTRPFVQNQPAYYGCRSKNADEHVYLIGDLIKGNTWTAQKVATDKSGTIKSSAAVKIKTVWQ